MAGRLASHAVDLIAWNRRRETAVHLFREPSLPVAESPAALSEKIRHRALPLDMQVCNALLPILRLKVRISLPFNAHLRIEVLFIGLDVQYRCLIQGIQACTLMVLLSTERISTTVTPMGLGRQGLLVASTPRSGMDLSPMGWTRSRYPAER